MTIDMIRTRWDNLKEKLPRQVQERLSWIELIILLIIVAQLVCRFDTSCILDILAFFAVYVIVTMSLNLQYGYGGIPNFGMVLSVAGGAYIAGALAGRVAMLYYGIGSFRETFSFYFIDRNAFITNEANSHLAHDLVGGIIILTICLIIGILVSFGLGYIASKPAIRLRADYLIIVLISMGEAFRIIGTQYPNLVGGTLWVNVPDVFLSLGEYRRVAYVGLLLGFAIFMFILIQMMTTSPFGRVLKAVRENQPSAEVLGKPTIRIKTLTLVVGSGIAGAAGVLWSFHTKVVLAAAFLRADWTFWPWLMAMIGGMGNNKGAAAGCGGVVVFRRLLIQYKHDLEQFLPFAVVWLEQIILGLALILFIMYRPQGIIPEEPTRLRGITHKDHENMLERAKDKAAESPTR